MEESNLARALNQTIITLFIAAIVFIYAQYFLKNLYLSIALTGAIALIIATETNHFRKKKTNRLNFEKEDLKFKDDIINHFLIMPTPNILEFFKDALNKCGIKTETLENTIATNSAIIAPLFNSVLISDRDILPLIKLCKQKNKKQLIVFCEKYEETNAQINGDVALNILNGYETFAFLKSLNKFPIKKTAANNKHKHIIISKTNHLSKNHFKPFFISSVFLFITSFLVPQKMYYITLASILLAISLICLAVFKKQKIEPKYEQILSSVLQKHVSQKLQK